jgi:Skp family chaperone for outer membrane proteins
LNTFGPDAETWHLPAPHFRLESGVVEKVKRLCLLAVFVSLAAWSSTFAQGTGTPQTAAVPPSKIAVIYSADFQDQKTGIARFTAAIIKLNGEFQKIQDDLSATAQRLRQQQEEITKLQQTPTATPAQIQARIDQLDQQKKDYQRRGEDAQAAYQKRRAELLTPLQEEVGKALDAYAKSRGITIVLDGSQISLLYASDSIDVTKAFIADYNSKNPATAAATPR